MSAASPYDNEKHREWVASGRCDSISLIKSWCNDSSGHTGRHGSPEMQPDGSLKWSTGYVWPTSHEWPRRGRGE